MIAELKKTAEQRMQKSLDALKHDLTRVRTGRAQPSLLEPVQVDYYGSLVPLSQVANITVEDARTLLVNPWEKNLIGAIEKAIINADLGLNPTNAGTVLRVPLPALTEERRKELVKVVKNEGESAKVAVRNIRRDANAELKTALKNKQITEDEARSAEEAIQKLTDKYVSEIDKILEQKEKELLTV
jgi:ribosome recycling factor